MRSHRRIVLPFSRAGRDSGHLRDLGAQRRPCRQSVIWKPGFRRSV